MSENPEDRTAMVRELLDDIPFHEAHPIEVERVTPERAVVKMPFDESIIGDPRIPAVHGGVISALIDVTGGAVFIGHVGDYTPTVDVNVNYLQHVGPETMTCRAEVQRRGNNIGVADMKVYNEGDEKCATGSAVYKLSR